VARRVLAEQQSAELEYVSTRGDSFRPTITAITHAASSAVGPVAPGELITAYGANLGLTTLTPLKVAANGLVDTTLAGLVSFSTV